MKKLFCLVLIVLVVGIFSLEPVFAPPVDYSSYYSPGDHVMWNGIPHEIVSSTPSRVTIKNQDGFSRTVYGAETVRYVSESDYLPGQTFEVGSNTWNIQSSRENGGVITHVATRNSAPDGRGTTLTQVFTEAEVKTAVGEPVTPVSTELQGLTTLQRQKYDEMIKQDVSEIYALEFVRRNHGTANVDSGDNNGANSQTNYYLYDLSSRGVTGNPLQVKPSRDSELDKMITPVTVTQAHLDFIRDHKNDGHTVTVSDSTIVATYTDERRSKGGTDQDVTFRMTTGDNPQQTKEVEISADSGGGNTVTLIYDINDRGRPVFKESTGTPFSSDRFSVNDAGVMTYGGKPGTPNDKTKMFEYADGSGFVREVHKTGADTLLIEKDASGMRITNLQTKQLTLRLSTQEAARFVKDDDTDAYLINLPTMLDAAKNNRIDREDLKRDGNNLIYDDATITINDEGKVVYTQGKGEERREVVYSSNGQVAKTTLGGAKSTSEIDWNYNTNGALESFDLGTNTYSVSEHRGEHGNVVMWCPGGGSGTTGCINLESNDVYNWDGSKWVKGSDDALEDTVKGHLEARRVGSGGPTDREQTAVWFTSVLESSQTGVGKLLSLFMGDEALIEWRQGVDDFFCSTVLLGGKDCWVSKVCGEYQDRTSEGTLTIETPGGMVDTAAHVEGERQDLFFVDEGEEKGEYLYKLSFAVRNPEDSDLDITFNVRLSGEKTLWLYNEDISVEEGDTFSRSGKKVLVEYSDTMYDNICVVFRESIRKKNGESINELCNDIVPVIGRSGTSVSGQNNGEVDF